MNEMVAVLVTYKFPVTYEKPRTGILIKLYMYTYIFDLSELIKSKQP